jgi:hypothetical protein
MATAVVFVIITSTSPSPFRGGSGEVLLLLPSHIMCYLLSRVTFVVQWVHDCAGQMLRWLTQAISLRYCMQSVSSRSRSVCTACLTTEGSSIPRSRHKHMQPKKDPRRCQGPITPVRRPRDVSDLVPRPWGGWARLGRVGPEVRPPTRPLETTVYVG